ncbi:hypothetical protein F1559_001340 [Cyanidiococcus yangmingshanensis]|uniref:Uncharacterized protein n=1 Tax=Cyanidiococcus yangmingshanensis TaxID=2690220 RepID=A0A7J7IGB2_9RHOD|nr:hypothetical protein F1559_001340 [Cyanidiococcus yangmingshanensis]
MARTNRILFEALCEETLETRCGRTQEEEYARCGRRVEGGAGSTRGNERALDMDMTLSTASGASWMHRAGVQCQRSLRITLGAPAAPNVSSCVQFRAGCGWSVVGADLELDIVFSDAEMVVLDGYTDTVPVDSVCSRTWRVRLQSPSDRPTEPYTQSVTAEFVGTTSHELMLSDEPDQEPFEEQFSNDSPNVFDFVVNVFALQPGTGVDERMHLGRAAVLGTELIRHDTRHANGNRFAFSTRRPIVTSPGRVVGEFIFSYVVIEPYQGRYRAEALSAALQHCRAGRPRGVRIARTMNVTAKGSVAAASSDSTRSGHSTSRQRICNRRDALWLHVDWSSWWWRARDNTFAGEHASKLPRRSPWQQRSSHRTRCPTDT